ncbi:MAG: hypothetical protein FJ197_01785 [Gammaproteobacteria bacterium]|nr:hypothetical protein [Gammaproteobacteria bacterium]
MSVTTFVIVLLLLIALWALAWRRQPVIALGITFGMLLVIVIGSLVGTPTLEEVPLWLPPLPFAIVALALLVFGILAWVWGVADQDQRTNSDSRVKKV